MAPAQELLRNESVATFKAMQQKICTALEACDGQSRFRSDVWDRTDLSGSHGGGGLTRVIESGAVIEKGGVNFSEVHGILPKEVAATLTGITADSPFFAAGTSLVIHPHSPHVPTIHANVRYFEVQDRAWFGGGIDLTPYVLNEEDALHFHSTLKEICGRHDVNYYPVFKKQCDEYFYIPHRNETRGLGGIFFDYLGRDGDKSAAAYKEFVYDVALSFNETYVPIVERRKSLSWTEAQKRFQLLRRGRYVEFNLVYDRGTLFGLKTGGRIESILMSLPLHASWEYDVQHFSEAENQLLNLFKKPRDWA